MLAGQQACEEFLFGRTPVLLTKRLADRQGPAGDQLIANFWRDGAVDRNIRLDDFCAWAGIDF